MEYSSLAVLTVPPLVHVIVLLEQPTKLSPPLGEVTVIYAGAIVKLTLLTSHE